MLSILTCELERISWGPAKIQGEKLYWTKDSVGFHGIYEGSSGLKGCLSEFHGILIGFKGMQWSFMRFNRI